jgi:methylated-DNA-[protein]-cysteine S-methyltransferase
MNTLASVTTRCIAQTTTDSPLGELRLARTDKGLAGVWFTGQKWHPAPFDAPVHRDDPLLNLAATQLNDYFAGRATRFDLPLDLLGTPFQQAVWRALIDIASGATLSYGALARQLGTPQAMRAVGAAVGRNPVSVIVPCHRVVGTDGRLTGYAGGLDRKRALLALEGVA